MDRDNKGLIPDAWLKKMLKKEKKRELEVAWAKKFCLVNVYTIVVSGVVYSGLEL